VHKYSCSATSDIQSVTISRHTLSTCFWFVTRLRTGMAVAFKHEPAISRHNSSSEIVAMDGSYHAQSCLVQHGRTSALTSSAAMGSLKEVPLMFSVIDAVWSFSDALSKRKHLIANRASGEQSNLLRYCRLLRAYYQIIFAILSLLP
jgi:hypothetical protein